MLLKFFLHRFTFVERNLEMSSNFKTYFDLFGMSQKRFVTFLESFNEASKHILQKKTALLLESFRKKD